MIVLRVLALVLLAPLSFSVGCDSAEVSRPPDPTATPTSTRTPTRTFPVAPTSTPAPTNTVPTLFTPSATPTASAAPATATPVPDTPTPGVPTATRTATATPTTPVSSLPRIDAGRAFVNDADVAFLDVVLSTGGRVVGGMQNDLLFDNTIISLDTASRCRINRAIGDQLPNCTLDPDDITEPCKTLARSLVQCGSLPQPDGCPSGARANISRFRGIIAATAVPNANPIPSGVLYTCEFDVVDRSRLPQAVLNANLVVADPSGNRLDEFAAGDGLVTVSARVAATALQGANELLLYPEDIAGFPGSGAVEVEGQVVGFNRTGTRLSLLAPLAQLVPADSVIWLALPPATPTRTPTSTRTEGLPTSTPTVTYSPTLAPSETPQPTAVATDTPAATPVATDTPSPLPTFTATPPATETPLPSATPQPSDTPVPTATSTVVASATPTGTATPVPPTSTATVVPTATVTFSVTPTRSATPLPTASATATATPADTPTPAAIIAAGSAAAAGAATVEIDVTLEAPGGNVGGVQNDLLFDNTVVGLPSAARCRINPAIGTALPNCDEDPELITEPCKTLSRLLVVCGGDPQPNGCPDGADESVSRFRAVIGATAVPNQNAIPAGVLYTCTFDVLDAASLPTVLQVTKVVAADPFGGRIEPAVGVDGEILP